MRIRTLALVLFVSLICRPLSAEPKLVDEKIDGPVLEVTFLDVGQGDAIFIQTPDGKNLLIDAGPNEKKNPVIDWLQKRGVKKIDQLLVTHSHADHVGLMKKLMLAIPVAQVLSSGSFHTNKMNEAILETMKEKSIPMRKVVGGDQFKIGEKVDVFVLAPVKSRNLDAENNNNNNSVVIKLSYGDVDFIFSGDAEKQAEKEILADYKDKLAAEILKVGHHGSETATTEDFFKAISPIVAILSLAENNKFSHPAVSTLDRFEAKKIKVYRTDQSGTIRLETDGKKIRIQTEGRTPVSSALAKHAWAA